VVAKRPFGSQKLTVPFRSFLFDRIIANVESDAVLETAALSILDDWLPKSDHAKFFRRNL
jgi:hypothetical protein